MSSTDRSVDSQWKRWAALTDPLVALPAIFCLGIGDCWPFREPLADHSRDRRLMRDLHVLGGFLCVWLHAKVCFGVKGFPLRYTGMRMTSAAPLAQQVLGSSPSSGGGILLPSLPWCASVNPLPPRGGDYIHWCASVNPLLPERNRRKGGPSSPWVRFGHSVATLCCDGVAHWCASVNPLPLWRPGVKAIGSVSLCPRGHGP